MSLVSTLGKIAMGVMVAKGVGKMMGNGGSGASSGGGLGGLLGGALGGGQQGGSGGGLLGGLLGGALGGQQGGGGAGDLLGGLLGGGQSGGQGGLAGQLGGLLSGGAQQGGQQSGGLGGLLDSLGGGGGAAAGGMAGGLGGLLNQALAGQEPESTPDTEKQAEVLLRAMLSAAKSDGEIDAGEREKLLKHLGDVSPEEQAFVQREMSSPVDVQALVASVPRGMEQQVYLMSLTAIDLDSQAEAQYLHQLAQGLNIDQRQCNAIHQQLGVQVLYS